MLQPARTKYRKMQKGRMRGKAYRGSELNQGSFGLAATECGWLTSRQIEAARVAISRYVKRGGKLWIRVFPDKPITKKPAETRMGTGKGAGGVLRGRHQARAACCSRSRASTTSRPPRPSLLAAHKLPVATKLVKRGVTL